MFTIDEIKKMDPAERAEVLKLRAQFHQKKAQVVANVGRIQKTGYNKYDDYPYATESDIKEGITALLSENKLSLDVHPTEHKKEVVPTAKGGQQYLFTVDMQFVLTDIESGFFEVYTSKGEGTDRGDKALYKAYTGCMKYFFINNFQIASGDDPETGGNVDQFSPANQPPKNNNYKKQQQNNNNNSNRKNDSKSTKPASPADPAAEIPATIKAKWKFIKGNLDGITQWIKEQQAQGLSLEDIDSLLQKEKEAKLAEKNKPVMGDSTFNPEDIDQELKVLDGGIS